MEVKVKAMVVVLGTQIGFPENLFKIRQVGASQKVILLKGNVRVKVKVTVKVKVKVWVTVMVIVLGTVKVMVKVKV